MELDDDPPPRVSDAPTLAVLVPGRIVMLPASPELPVDIDKVPDDDVVDVVAPVAMTSLPLVPSVDVPVLSVSDPVE